MEWQDGEFWMLTEELERVFNSELRDIETAKKMIKLLVAYSKEEIPLTKENEDFIGL